MIPGHIADRLPARFVFGAATAAAQIEGGAAEGGRTSSIWDAFAAVPGKIADGSTPTVAVDHYHRWREDVSLLADLGVDAYRLSLSWSRLLPSGRGPLNPSGVTFYSRLIDALLERDIAPWVTLYHWDMPVEIMIEGGWLDRGSVDAFEEYVAAACGAFGDRVAAWMTINEPVVHTGYGYALGIEAPGLTLYGAAFQAAHHQLLAHGRAAAVLRETGSPVGIVNNHTPVRAASDRDEDLLAAGMYDVYHNGQYAQPVLSGGYPDALQMIPGAAWDCVHDGDLAAIAAPLDFYGVNYYQPTTVAADPANPNLPFAFVEPADGPVTDFGWPIDPAALTEFLVGLRAAYPNLPPVYITENGCAYDDVRDADGRLLADTARIDYLDAHLGAVADAIDAGVDVRGYFHWSLMDNWEWAEGMTRRFGLVRIDPETLDRTPRASFGHYRDLIAAHRSRGID
ncbi:MAG: beta-glucosidase [Actinobacteria bacterium 69-20]|nr:beta-glucosidase [Actinomycetota bacterium]OJV30894.1 MAG: beta-glucosidase [Actinobacteria bacterium 69-20]